MFAAAYASRGAVRLCSPQPTVLIPWPVHRRVLKLHAEAALLVKCVCVCVSFCPAFSRREAITDYNRALVLASEMHTWVIFSLRCWEPWKCTKMFLSQAPDRSKQ